MFDEKFFFSLARNYNSLCNNDAPSLFSREDFPRIPGKGVIVCKSQWLQIPEIGSINNFFPRWGGGGSCDGNEHRYPLWDSIGVRRWGGGGGESKYPAPLIMKSYYINTCMEIPLIAFSIRHSSLPFP